MADKKISQLTSLAQGDVAVSTDTLPIVDTSAVETKKIAVNALVGAAAAAGLTSVDINSGTIDGTSIGSSSASTGAFTTLSASSTVSGTGFSTYLASPPAIGGTAAAAGSFTTLSASSTVSGTGFTNYLASPPAIGSTAANTGAFTTLTTSSTVTLNGGTANGVLYLNGSKVATSGSALTFDGNNLGLSVASPDARITIPAPSFSSTATGGTIRFKDVGTSDSVVQSYYVSTEGTDINLASNAYVATSGSFTRFDATKPSAYINVNRGGNIQFAVGSAAPSEQMRLNSTGLGIGTSSPASRLHVVSSTNTPAQIQSSGTTSAYLQMTNTGGGGYISTNNNDIVFSTTGSATERMRLDSSGNLGIGTSSPAVRLNVSSSGEVVRWTSSSATGSNYQTFVNSGGRKAYLGLANGSTDDFYVHNDASAAIIFDTANAERARITSAGNFGIGTTSPAYPLDVAGAVQSSGYYMNGNTSGGFVWVRDNYALRFGTNDTERARITSDGKLLVNCTNGNGRLTVRGPGTTTGYSFEAANSGGATRFLVSDNGLVQFYKSDDAESARITAGGYFLLGTPTERESRLVIEALGQSPTYGMTSNMTASSGTRYHVIFRESGTEKGSITSDGSNTSYNTSSDIRLKDNVKDANEAGAKIDAIKVRQFDWKESKEHVDYGFIAQELNDVAPSAVTRPDNEENMWSVDYSKLVPMLVKEIQSLRARVAQLESK